VILEFQRREEDFALVHTGQHYDEGMSAIFFKELGLPSPDRNLDVGSGSHAEQTGTALIRLERTFVELGPEIVVVQGDTNTVLAAALAGGKLGLKVAHVEAGLRSYDRRMPEEHNRRLTDHLSDFLFAPTHRAAETLKSEGCWGAISTTGNTVIDACLRYADKAAISPHLADRVPKGPFALATAHRAENVDDPRVLEELARILVECPVPVAYPIHPRTKERFAEAGLERTLDESDNVHLLPPLGYFDLLHLLRRCTFVLTDSGGIQEEATAPNIQKKVFVLRESTERPEAVEAGYAEVLGTRASVVLDRIRQFLDEGWTPPGISPFGDGRAGERIVETLATIGRSSPSG